MLVLIRLSADSRPYKLCAHLNLVLTLANHTLAVCVFSSCELLMQDPPPLLSLSLSLSQSVS